MSILYPGNPGVEVAFELEDVHVPPTSEYGVMHRRGLDSGASESASETCSAGVVDE